MNWTFDEIHPANKAQMTVFSIEGGTSTWLKKFAAARKVTKAEAVRRLVMQAVAFWQANRQPLDRKFSYPFALFAGKHGNHENIGVRLDPEILNGLREIAQLTGKSVSRVVSEILLDAKNAHDEIEQARRNFGAPDRLRA
jgi:hypothetical protein